MSIPNYEWRSTNHELPNPQSTIFNLQSTICAWIALMSLGVAALGDTAADPTRAGLALEQIEPRVDPPRRTESLEPPSPQAVKRMTTARDLIAKQRFASAELKLKEALSFAPHHPDIHRTLAALQWRRGNAARAGIHATRALAINPDDASAHYFLGRCHALDGDYPSAITEYRTSLLCSDFGAALEAAVLCHYYLAQALAAEGYLEASLAQYGVFERKTRGLDARADESELAELLRTDHGMAGMEQAAILEKLGRFADAADLVAPLAATAVPTDTGPGVRYARLLMRAGRLDGARAAVRVIPSDDEEVLEVLLDIHRQAGQPERAIEDLRTRFAARPSEPRCAENLAEALMRFNRADEALQTLQYSHSQNPGADAVRARLVDMLLARSAWAQVLELCAEDILRRPGQVRNLESIVLALASNEEAVSRLLAPRQGRTTPVAEYLRGRLALEVGRIDQAQALLLKCHNDDASFSPARAALAEVYLRRYRYVDALRIAARKDPGVAEDARLEAVLGAVYERLDDLGRAESHFKAALELDRADSETMFALAEVYRQLGDGPRAQEQLRALLEQAPDHEAARERLGLFYLEEERREAAQTQLDELKRRSPASMTTARCEARLKHSQDGDRDAYRSVLTSALKQGKPDADTWVAFAQSYDGFQQAQAVDAYRNALALEPDHEDALVGLFLAQQRMLRFEEAAEQLETLLPMRPNRHSWRHGLIEVYRVIQDYDAAAALIRRQLARDDLDEPARASYRVELIDTLHWASSEEEALDLLRTWARDEPEHPSWQILLAERYLQYDQASQAVEIYEGLLQSASNDQNVLGGLLSALEAVSRHDRAAQYAIDWLHEDPEHDMALAQLIQVLAGADRIDDALELARNRLLHTKSRTFFQGLIIQLLRHAERHDEHIEWIESLLEEVRRSSRGIHARSRSTRKDPSERAVSDQIIRRPDEPFSAQGLHLRTTQLRGALAEALILSGDHREAHRRLTRWLERTPDVETWFDYLRLLTLCRQQQGRKAAAQEALEQALALRPEHVQLNNDVAYGWIDRGVRLDEAEAMIRFAVSRAPRQLAYLDTYGWLLYKQGSFAEAKKWLLRAARTPGRQDAVILDHLGDACWRLGETQEAVTHWSAAVELIKALPGDDLNSDDERRVRETVGKKIEAAEAHGAPNVAPIAE